MSTACTWLLKALEKMLLATGHVPSTSRTFGSRQAAHLPVANRLVEPQQLSPCIALQNRISSATNTLCGLLLCLADGNFHLILLVDPEDSTSLDKATQVREDYSQPGGLGVLPMSTQACTQAYV